MNRSKMYYLPKMNRTIISRHSRGTRKGKGVGSVLLDGGMGGQSSYPSIDQYLSITNAPASSVIGRGLESVKSKMENLMIKPSVKKVKNIKFTL